MVEPKASQTSIREAAVPNEARRVPELRKLLSSWLDRLYVPDDVSFEVLVAVGEAIANSARHGRREDGAGSIRLSCSAEGPRLSATVSDDGPGFNPGAAEPVSDEPLQNDRRGFFLMRELMDDVDVSSSQRGTEVTLVKRLPLSS